MQLCMLASAVEIKCNQRVEKCITESIFKIQNFEKLDRGKIND